MNIADPLSRLCIISDCEKTNDDEHVNQIVENAKPCAISLTEIKMHSEQDSEILELPIPPAPMKRRELLDAPWVDIAMDLLGPLPSNDYLLVVVDYYSRHKEVKITKTITSCNNQAIERNIWQPRTTIESPKKKAFPRIGKPFYTIVTAGVQLPANIWRRTKAVNNLLRRHLGSSFSLSPGR
ncbi:unnamed protein product [Leptosia nina]|uniref:Integrase catalytic domain-containing protein n=1 Tax=Leptosia nina TaxID=320188 RepID=A0AAV1JIB3_9NEOP